MKSKFIGGDINVASSYICAGQGRGRDDDDDGHGNHDD